MRHLSGNKSMALPLLGMQRIEGRQWNNDLNSWTGFNGQYLEGGLVAWGNADYGGTPTEPIGYAFSNDDKLLHIFSNQYAFAALTADNKVRTWGNADYGGDKSKVDDGNGELADVVNIFSTDKAFAALKGDGTVVTWGSDDHGGASGSVVARLVGVVDVVGTSGTFAALRNDGTVVVWGGTEVGVDSGGTASSTYAAVKNALEADGNINKVWANDYAFAATLYGGSALVWGDANKGGAFGAGMAGQMTDLATKPPSRYCPLNPVQEFKSLFHCLPSTAAVPCHVSIAPRPKKKPTSHAADEGMKTEPVTIACSLFHLVKHRRHRHRRATATAAVVAAVATIASLLPDEIHAAAGWGPDMGYLDSRTAEAVADVSLDDFEDDLLPSPSLLPAFPLDRERRSRWNKDSSSWVGSTFNYADEGGVYAWGDATAGGSTTSPVNIKASLTYGVPVERIFVNKVAFAALVDGGGVITWGDAAGGGDSSAVAAELATGVHSIYATDR
eukprot:gene18237-15237_t